MGNALGPVLVNIFMVEFERSILPQLGDITYFGGRYVDDTFVLVKKNETASVLNIINNYHMDI